MNTEQVKNVCDESAAALIIFDRIIALLGQSVDALVEAAGLVVQLVDEHPGFMEEFCEVREVNPAMLRRLERVGRGLLVSELMLRHGAGYRTLERMPVDVQRRFLKEPVELLVYGGDTLRVAIGDLSPAQAAQVFDRKSGVVRSLGAQRAWLADVGRVAVDIDPPKMDRPYKVSRGAVKILSPTTLSRRDLLDILGQMGD
jgi:hypothetical protein